MQIDVGDVREAARAYNQMLDLHAPKVVDAPALAELVRLVRADGKDDKDPLVVRS